MPQIFILKNAEVGIETTFANLQPLIPSNVTMCLHIFVQSCFQYKCVFMKLAMFFYLDVILQIF